MNKPNSRTIALVVSYIPFFDYTKAKAGLGGTSPEELTRILDDVQKSDAGRCKGIAWTVDERGFASPVMIVQNAWALKEHMQGWAEGDLQSWFSIHYERDSQGLVFAMVPDFEKTVERTNRSSAMVGSPILKEDMDYEVFSLPITFETDKTENFDRARDFFGPDMKVYFLEEEFVKEGQPFNPDILRHTIELGTFRLNGVTRN